MRVAQHNIGPSTSTFMHNQSTLSAFAALGHNALTKSGGIGEFAKGLWNNAAGTVNASAAKLGSGVASTLAGVGGLVTGGFHGAGAAADKSWNENQKYQKQQTARATSGAALAGGLAGGAAARVGQMANTGAAGLGGLLTGGFHGAGTAADNAWNRGQGAVGKADAVATVGRSGLQQYGQQPAPLPLGIGVSPGAQMNGIGAFAPKPPTTPPVTPPGNQLPATTPPAPPAQPQVAGNQLPPGARPPGQLF